MAITKREHHIKVLEQFLHDYQEWGEDLEVEKTIKYAVSSLKTDEAYQLMYEGGEVFTKDEVVAMLTEIKDEASNICPTIGNCTSFAEGIRAYDKLIQQKINSLKEDTNQ